MSSCIRGSSIKFFAGIEVPKVIMEIGESESTSESVAILPLLSPQPLKRPRGDSTSSPPPAKHCINASDSTSVYVCSGSQEVEVRRDSVEVQDYPTASRQQPLGDLDLEFYRRTVRDRTLAPEYEKQWAEDCQCFDTLKVVRLAGEKAPPACRIVLPKTTTRSKLLIFDLDNTLVHCSPSTQGAHHTISVTLPTGKAVSAGIRIRPFARECLQLANQLFEVAVFTASHSCYSDQVIDLLDPGHVYVQHRLFREHCLLLDNKYLVKDLRILANYDLKDVVIVENCILSYALQLYNGVPVPTWNGERSDSHLKVLMRYFRALSQCADVRELNRQIFESYYCCLTDEDV